jgi:hypothetical protein
MWPQKGTLSPGADADIALIDPQRKVEVLGREMLSASDYDVYEGYKGVGWPVMTMLRGEVVARDGQPHEVRRDARRAGHLHLDDTGRRVRDLDVADRHRASKVR